MGFAPDLRKLSAEALGRAKLLFFNYPNNPTGAVVPDGLFDDVVALAREHDLLAVHDNAYSETTYDGYVAPSFLATPGAKEVGVEVFSLSKGYNMTGWRCAAIVGNAEAIAHFWQLKSNVDSGLFEAVQLAGVAALQPAVDADVAAMNAVYARRRDLVCDALAESGVRVTKPKGTIYVWAPIPVGFESSAAYCEHVLERAAVVVSPGGAYGRERRGLLPDLADDPRRPPAGGGATTSVSVTTIYLVAQEQSRTQRSDPRRREREVARSRASACVHDRGAAARGRGAARRAP